MAEKKAKDRVYEVLRKVIDPELGINIIDLGLVYKVKLKTQNSKLKTAHIVMTLTTPGCPLGGWFVESVTDMVAEELKIDPSKVTVEIVFDPPWTQDMMNGEAVAELGLD